MSLLRVKDNRYIMQDDETSTVVLVSGIEVEIKRTPDGLVVEVWKKENKQGGNYEIVGFTSYPPSNLATET